MKTALLLIGLVLFGFCPLSANQNGDCDCNGRISITDVVYLVNYIFGGGPAPKDCFPKADSTVVLYWTTPGDSNVSNYEIRWSYDYDELINWDSANVVVVSDSVHMYTTYPSQRNGFPLFGVNDDSVYYIGVKTRNSNGIWSDISNVLSFTRLRD